MLTRDLRGDGKIRNLYYNTVDIFKKTEHPEKLREAIAEGDLEEAAKLSDLEEDEFFNLIENISTDTQYLIEKYGKRIESHQGVNNE